MSDLINCFRDHLEVNPFISASETLSLSVEPAGKGTYRGVNFTTSPAVVSPHIGLTHCESALHVYCREAASSLSEVLASKAEYGHELRALHIKVNTTPCNSFIYETSEAEPGTSIYVTRFGEEDTYAIYSAAEPQEGMYDQDRIVTKEAVMEAVAAVDNAAGVQPTVVLIDIIGEEECMKDWAFLSNDAVFYLINELCASVIVANTPSIDRESDGGYVPNHKTIFEVKSNLVVELAKLSHLPAQYGSVLLNITPHDTYADCGPCRVQFRPDA
jgi:hypothetical protein